MKGKFRGSIIIGKEENYKNKWKVKLIKGIKKYGIKEEYFIKIIINE